MSLRSAIDPRTVDIENPTRAVFDASETRVEEIQSFVRRNDCEVHLERRGGQTDLVVRVE